MEMAVQLIKWFNNHSYVLRVFNKEQKSSPLGKTLALIASVVTHWTAYYCALNHLLVVKNVLQVTIIKHRNELVDCVRKK